MSTEVKEAIEPMSQGRAFSIEVSERVRRLPPYLFGKINRLKYEKRRAGDDVIDLGMGNPTDPPQDLVIEKLCEAARDPKNHRYCEAAGSSTSAAKWPPSTSASTACGSTRTGVDRLPGLEGRF